MQRIRLRFAKRGRLRFLSHRDVARCFERAVRRAGVPVAHSHGFSPHPRLSWIGAAPTCSASEAEYVEIGLTRPLDPAELALALDAALPDGLDILAAAVGEGAPLAERIDAGRWSVELPGLDPDAVRAAVAELWARESVVVERVIPSGRRQIDVRTALVRLDVDDCVGDSVDDSDDTDTTDTPPASARMTARSPVCAILAVVVRQTTPAVRPDDVLSALDVVAGLRPPVPPKATRMAQGLLDDRGDLADPLGSDRVTTRV